MRDAFLPFSPPLIGEEEIAELLNPLHIKFVGVAVGSRIGAHASLELRYK